MPIPISTGSWEVNRLVVVAGPTCSGKSTFIKELLEGNHPIIADQMQIGQASAWECVSANRLRASNRIRNIDRLILHYDFVTPWAAGLQSIPHGETFRLLRSTEQVTFLTIWVNPEDLRKRIRLEMTEQQKKLNAWGVNRIIMDTVADTFSMGLKKWLKKTVAGKYKLAFLEARLTKHQRAESLYAEPARLILHYDRWFDFCESYGAKAHWVLDCSEQLAKLNPVAEWRERKYR